MLCSSWAIALLAALGCNDSRARETSFSLGEESPAPVVRAREALGSLDDARAALVIPPVWLGSVETHYDTEEPWTEGRLEVRRLLALGDESARREALKLMWIYREKGDFSDGHEYPMYTFLGAEPVWSIVAHEDFLAQPAGRKAMHAYRSLASLYAGFGEYAKAKEIVDLGFENVADPPWRVLSEAQLFEVLGDVCVASGDAGGAKAAYREATRLYPTARPTYGRHLLAGKAARSQAKLDLLSASTLAEAPLADGEYHGRALGFSGDVDVTVDIAGHQIASVRVRHRETMTRGAERLVPAWIVTLQSLDVDGVTGATQTRDAVVASTLAALRKAGLE